MSAALLSRFDLVFILLDKHDELLDKRVSEHIMSVSYPSWPFSIGIIWKGDSIWTRKILSNVNSFHIHLNLL